ncbi:MAG: glycosyltransferase [Chloroflexota bacterium]
MSHSKYTFVILSTTDWDAPQFGSRQQIALQLAKRGHQVLFTEQPRALHSLISDRKKSLLQTRRWLEGGLRTVIPDLPNLQVYSPPPVLPIFYHPLTNPISQRILKIALRRTLKRLGWQADIFWTYWANSDYLVGAFREKMAVYHCIDNFRASGYPFVSVEHMIALEERLCQKVDYVFTRTTGSADLLKPHSHRLAILDGGVDLAQFDASREFHIPPELADVPSPRIGLVGSLDDRLDVELLDYVANRHPDVQLVLAGFYRAHLVDLSTLLARANVHLLPAVPHHRVPEFVAQFDVCLIPYRVNDFTREVSPLKLYEFLAMGKPVVATPLPYNCREEKHIYLAETSQDFANAVGEALNEPVSLEVQASRRQAAEPHTWANQVDMIEQDLQLRNGKEIT